MKKSPNSKKTAKTPIKPKIPVLPSTNVEMENYIEKNKATLMESIVDIIDYGVKKNLMNVEALCFDKSGYIVVIPRKEFRENLNNIFEASLSSENYELCGKVNSIIKMLAAPKLSKEQKSANLLQHVKKA